jgi:hypothetical protein
MTSDQTVRIGDHERELVSAELRAHFTSGRLGMDEFSNRLDQAWSATTLADLVAAVRDLPPVPGHPRPWDRPGTVPTVYPPVYATGGPPGRTCGERMARGHVRTFLKVSLVLVLIWAVTGFGYFWPFWPLAFWGFFVIRHAMWGRRHERYRLERAPRY